MENTKRNECVRAVRNDKKIRLKILETKSNRQMMVTGWWSGRMKNGPYQPVHSVQHVCMYTFLQLYTVYTSDTVRTLSLDIRSQSIYQVLLSPLPRRVPVQLYTPMVVFVSTSASSSRWCSGASIIQ